MRNACQALFVWVLVSLSGCGPSSGALESCSSNSDCKAQLSCVSSVPQLDGGLGTSGADAGGLGECLQSCSSTASCTVLPTVPSNVTYTMTCVDSFCIATN